MREVLEKEKERHWCTLKLLEELSNSSTEGTNNKWQLDVTKLQPLKVLVFSRFHLDLPQRSIVMWSRMVVYPLLCKDVDFYKALLRSVAANLS